MTSTRRVSCKYYYFRLSLFFEAETQFAGWCKGRNYRISIFLRTRNLIETAISHNDFLRNLEVAQIREIVDCMYPVGYPSGALIIKEHEVGSIMYVIEGT